MKNIIRVMALLLCVCLLATCFVACGNKKDAKTGDKKEKVEMKTESKEPTSPLVGKWAYDSFVYTFNDDGTGTYDALGTLMKFTYKDNGDSIEFLYEGNTDSMVLNYTIDGKTLTVEDSFGEPVEYTKK